MCSLKSSAKCSYTFTSYDHICCLDMCRICSKVLQSKTLSTICNCFLYSINITLFDPWHGNLYRSINIISIEATLSNRCNLTSCNIKPFNCSFGLKLCHEHNFCNNILEIYLPIDQRPTTSGLHHNRVGNGIGYVN